MYQNSRSEARRNIISVCGYSNSKYSMISLRESAWRVNFSEFFSIDLAPTVLLDITKSKSTNSKEIIIENNEQTIGIISKQEPGELEIIWIQNSPKLFWIDFEMRIIKLVDAGYPGCIGCGGPGSEETWNEQQNRFLSRQ